MHTLHTVSILAVRSSNEFMRGFWFRFHGNERTKGMGENTKKFTCSQHPFSKRAQFSRDRWEIRKKGQRS